MLAFTLAGALSSALVGAVVGMIGQVVFSGVSDRAAVIMLTCVGVLGAAREFRLVRIPLPQLHRQTNGSWAKTIKRPLSPMLWGFDVGLGFSTWVMFSGLWFVTLLALISGSVALGIMLFLGYWIGRALSLWLGPLLMPNARATLTVLRVIHARFLIVQRIHAAALLYAVFWVLASTFVQLH